MATKRAPRRPLLFRLSTSFYFYICNQWRSQDFQQLNFELQRAEWWDGRASTTFAVSKVMRDVQFQLRTDWHQGQSFNPASDNAVNRELCWLAALYGAIKHGAIDQLTGVVNAHAILTARDW